MRVSTEVNSSSANQLQEIVTKNVRILIAAENVNQEDLSTALGIAQSGLSRKVNRRTDWSASDIANLANYFNLSFAEIVTPLPLFSTEYRPQHNVEVDISRESATPIGARYLRKPDENESRTHGAVGPRTFVMPLQDAEMQTGPRFSARTRIGLPHLDSNQDKGFQRPVCCHYTMGERRNPNVFRQELIMPHSANTACRKCRAPKNDFLQPFKTDFGR